MPTPRFFEKLQEIYNKSGLQDYWESERDHLLSIIPQIVTEIAFNYEILEPLAVGGSGVVILVTDRNLAATRVLKISRPSPGKERLLATILQSETENLKRLSHQNLIRIFAQGNAKHKDGDFPFYVMDFVRGAQDADKYLQGEGIEEWHFLKIIEETIHAIQYLHHHDTIHLDIKPANILVTPAPLAILSDLGFAKYLQNQEGQTLIGGTEGFIHPDARRFLTVANSDPNRRRGKALRADLKKTWDLFSFGKTLFVLLGVLDLRPTPILSPYTKRYLRLMACRMLDGHNQPNELAMGLSARTISEIKYESIDQILIDFNKITGTYSLTKRIPELDPYLQDTIQMSSVTTTPFTSRVRAVVNCPSFVRLDYVTQLGLVNYIYPTAVHTRYAHSLGTFSILVRVIVALYNDTLNPLFRQIMDEEDLKAAMLSSLLHDLGQYPLAHDLEEADIDLFSHEEITKQILLSDKELRAVLEKLWGVTAERVISILEAKPETLGGSLKDRILHSLIDGPIDSDKMDYLVRDSEECKLNFSNGLDIKRLFRCFTVVFRQQGEQTYAALGIHEKGKICAEDIAWVRYKMFGQVYWHHTYRAIKAMIHRMTWEMIAKASSPGFLKTDFHKLVTPDTFDDGQQSFFGPPTPKIKSSTTRIHFADLEVLSYIENQSGTKGKELFDLIRERKLFKRVLVLAHDRSPDKRVWEKCSEFYRLHGKNRAKKLLLQTKYQDALVSLAERPELLVNNTTIIDNDARNKFIVESRDKITVIVDFPPERAGASGDLEYVIEEDRRRYKSDELQIGSLEESVIWKTLKAKFHESIGKLRVFSHPDHEVFIRTFFPRDKMENILIDVITECSRATV